MSQTTNLQLNKHDDPSTNENQFDIENYLNANWDKIDEAAGESTEVIQELEQEIQNLKEASYKVSGTGTNVTLNNTSNNKFLKLDVKGNTEQIQLSGKNKIDITTLTDGYISSGGGISTQHNQGEKYSEFIKVSPNTNYIFSIIETSSTYENWFGVGEYTSNNFSNFVRRDVMSTTTQTYIQFQTSATTEYIVVSARNLEQATKIQLEEGSTATAFEPYCGGIPSPNPTFPQNIKNVTGNANVKIQNKNWLPFKNQDFTINGMNFKVVNGEFIINGTATAEISSRSSGFIENFSFILSPGTYYFKKTSGINGYIREYEGNNTVIQQNQGSFTITKEVKAYYGIYMANATSKSNAINTDQVEVGSSFSSYVTHQEQNLPLTLGTIELDKLDTAQDYFYKENNKWYLHKEIGKTILNGTETWQQITGAYYYTPTNMKYRAKALMSHFTYTTTGIGSIEDYQFTTISGNGYSIWIKQIESSIANLKTWLSSNNVVLNYELATPTNTEITDTTLIEQLNAIKEAMSYYGQTNISSTSNEASAKIDATAIGDLNLVIS